MIAEKFKSSMLMKESQEGRDDFEEHSLKENLEEHSLKENLEDHSLKENSKTESDQEAEAEDLC